MRTQETSPTTDDPRPTPGAPVVVAAAILCTPALAEGAGRRGLGTAAMLGALTLLALSAEAWDHRTRQIAPARRRWTAFTRARQRSVGRPVTLV